MSKTLTFQFTQEQAQVIALGLDALLRARGLEVAAAVADVNNALQSQAAAQLQAADAPSKFDRRVYPNDAGVALLKDNADGTE